MTGKILVIKLCCLGDIIQLTPALRSLKENGAEVHLACVKWVKEITEYIPYIDKTHVFDPKNPFSALMMLAGLRREKFTLAINFHRDKKSYFFSKAAGPGKLAGFRWKGYEKGFDIKAEFDSKIHETERYLSLTDALGIKRVGEYTHIDKPEKPEIKAKTVGPGIKIGIFPGGGVNPGTVMTSKRWPADNFKGLADNLSGRGMKVYVFGGPMDRGAVDEIIKSVPGSVPVITGLKDFIYYAAKMDCFIASDTGPLHIAAATGVRSIGLYGPSSPGIFGARGKNSVNISENISCSPCYEPDSVHKREFLKCKDNICMKKISVSKVEETILNLLDSKPGQQDSSNS